MDSTSSTVNNSIENSDNKPKIKKVYAYDKERKNLLMRQYFEKNKDEKRECPDCGKYYSIFNSSHHKKSKYHNDIIKFLQKKNKII
jgi:hypothetical protein